MRSMWVWVGCAAMAANVAGAQVQSAAQAQAPASVAASPRAGYLTAETLPSSAVLVPVPPAAGSAAFARDEEIHQKALALQGSARWELAMQDAKLSLPDLAETFSCALTITLSETQTPRAMRLLRRTLIDAGRSTAEAKKRYQRARPFMTNGKPVCTPLREDALRADGSYPSGHSAIGYALALVLSELVPERTEALISRGRAYGHSRVVCNVHWASDVAEGQLMGAAVVARLHAEPEFRADLEAARAEIAALRYSATRLERDCKGETEALAQ